jgi:pimeloyl-ACP methyl ester carboxylesterase
MAMPTFERFTVESGGNVGISVMKTGAGPALLLIHGALLNATLSWAAVLPSLAGHFTVYAMDRRGRAPSGDAEDYSISLEAGDIVRVIEAIGRPVIVLAHSYGALATLEALDDLKTGVAQLILYEPPFALAPLGPEAEKVMLDMESALQANDREKIATVFLRDQIGAPPERLEAFRSSPIWPIVLQIASTLPREARAVNTPRDLAERLARCNIPTTMLLGSETQGRMRDNSIFVSKTIPESRLMMLEGQGHAAMMEAPDFFAGKIVEIAQSAALG